MELAEIKNCEILRSGKWNNIEVSEKDLDEMISNFKNGVVEPYINLNHDDKFTEKVSESIKVIALGWVSDLRREGDRLIADFKQVPVKIAGLIRDGALKKRSVEFFRKGFKLNDKVYDNVLKAVSFFGADIPAVNGLADDFAVLMSLGKAITEDTAQTITLKTDEGVRMDKIEIPKAEYDNLIALKAKSEGSEAELVKVSDEVVNLKADIASKDKEIETLNKFKAEVEKHNAESTAKAADEFIVSAIKEGKILPAHKDYFIAEFIEKSKDESKIAIFKADISGRAKVINLAPVNDKKEVDNKVIDLSKMSNDEINEAIEAKMKADNVSYEKAAVSLKIPGFKAKE